MADRFPTAFAKSQLAANSTLPLTGTSFVSVADRDKAEVIPSTRALAELGYRLFSTRGTAAALRAAGIPVEEVPKLQEGRPNLIDHMKNEQIVLVINTPSGKGTRTDEGQIRAAAVAPDAVRKLYARGIARLRQELCSLTRVPLPHRPFIVALLWPGSRCANWPRNPEDEDRIEELRQTFFRLTANRELAESIVGKVQAPPERPAAVAADESDRLVRLYRVLYKHEMWDTILEIWLSHVPRKSRGILGNPQ